MAENNPTQVSFFAPAGQPGAVFNVREGLPADEAMELAGLFLAAGITLATNTANDLGTGEAWATVYQLEMAKALVDQASMALLREKQARHPLSGEAKGGAQ